MKNLGEIVLGALLLFNVGCFSGKTNDMITAPAKEENEMANIIPDPDNAYKWAYPDTTFHQPMKEKEFCYESHDSSGKTIHFVRRFYDSNFNKIPNIIASYLLKKFDSITENYEIDSTKAPSPITRDKEDGKKTIYFYSKKYNTYIKLLEEYTIDFKEIIEH